MSCAPAPPVIVIVICAAAPPALVVVVYIAAPAPAPFIIVIVIIVLASVASCTIVSQYVGPYRAKQPGFCTYILTSKFVALTNSPTLYSAIPIGSRCNRDSLAISCPPGSFTHPTISFVASRLSRPF